MKSRAVLVAALPVALLLGGCVFCPFPNTSISAQQGYYSKFDKKIKKNKEVFLGSYVFGENVDLTDHSLALAGSLKVPEDKRQRGLTLSARWVVSGLERTLEGAFEVRVKKDGEIPLTKVEYPLEQLLAGESLAMFYTAGKGIPAGSALSLFVNLERGAYVK